MNSAELLGYEQFYKNFQVDENPFEDGEIEALWWLSGWLEAERDWLSTRMSDNGGSHDA